MSPRRNAFLVLIVAGCGGASTNPGLDAWLRVDQAQFVAGDLLDIPGQDQPAVISVTNTRTEIFPGQRDKPVKGTLARESTAAAIGLAGDAGYWIVVAGVPDLDAPELPTFHLDVSFSPALPTGPRNAVVRAVDADGRFGPPALVPLVSTETTTPAGKLVVSLWWDTEADLDLHVVDPSGVEIWARNINSYTAPLPGDPVDPDAWQAGGILDFDSNGNCTIDGRRRENTIWKTSAPPGHYVVRVDTASLCQDITARWTVDVFHEGAPVGSAEGQSIRADTRHSKGAGGGVTALEFDLAQQ